MRHGTSSPARVLLATGLAAVLGAGAATAAHAGAAQAGPVAVTGTATNTFDPADIKVTPDAKGEVTITFTSQGAPHTLENKDIGMDTGIVNAGDSKTITFKAPEAGQYKVICLLHEGQGMVGTLTVAGKGAATTSATASAPSASEPPATASASATVGTPDDNAPTAGADDGGGDSEEGGVPGVAGNESLERIEAERAAQEGAVSGFKFFTMVCIAFLFILGAAVLFSTRPRRAGR